MALQREKATQNSWSDRWITLGQEYQKGVPDAAMAPPPSGGVSSPPKG
jgi:hypothetical protein